MYIEHSSVDAEGRESHTVDQLFSAAGKENKEIIVKKIYIFNLNSKNVHNSKTSSNKSAKSSLL